MLSFASPASIRQSRSAQVRAPRQSSLAQADSAAGVLLLPSRPRVRAEPAQAGRNRRSHAPPSAPTRPGAAEAGARTTTVVVHGEVEDNYLPEAVTVGTLDGEPLKNAPLSATVVTRDLLNDQVARLLSDVVKNDASVGDDYVPVGYYGVYEIRGFPIDLATGLEINGMTIAGEQDVPLENKERVEFLKGIAGVESGVASAGGLIDYVTKRPADVQALDLATDHRGTAYGAVDLGHLFGRAEAGGRARQSCRRKNRDLYERHQWLARGRRGRGRLEAVSQRPL